MEATEPGKAGTVRPVVFHALRLLPHHLHAPFQSGAVVALSLASAAAYGLAAVLQHQAAVREPPELSMTTGLMLRLVRRPMWVVGNLLDVGAFVLQFLALRRGSLALVEPILVLSLVFALPASALLARRPVGRRDVVSALAMALGLGLFLAAGRPGAGHPHGTPLGWVLLTAVVAATVAASVLGARGATARRAGLLLAVGSGVAFGYVAAVAERTGHLLDRGVVHTLASAAPYELAIGGLTALVLTQSAYHAGDLRLSLPTLTVVQPLVAIAIGQSLFAEHLRTHGWAPLVETVGLLSVVVGVSVLAHPATIGVGEGA